MDHYFFRDFLSRFDAHGSLSCPCGLVHHVATRTVLVSPGALEESAALLAGQYGSKARLWVLSDENTEAAAGRRWKSAAGSSRIAERILDGRAKVVPTTDLASALAAEARKGSPDLLVAVGSGVISDLVKRVSLELDLPNWCVATAASVDAYTSATAAIRVNGYHGALPARISETVVCDLDVIAKAPREMFLAGLGDLLAKYLAHLDWNLSRIVTGESYCGLTSTTALESARSALAAARMLRDDPLEAQRCLIDAALCSGFSMQATGASRSAASAEHTLAHFWETTHAAKVERLDLHGILAGAASKVVLDVYRVLYERLEDHVVDDYRRLAAFDAEPPWQETIEPGLSPFRSKVEEEMAGRHLDRGILAGRLEAFRAGRVEILGLARTALRELSSAVELLSNMGYPFSTTDLGIDPELVRLPLRNIRLLRQRYNGFDLAWELGLDGLLEKEYARMTGMGA